MIETSPARRRRKTAAMRREEAGWSAKSGPVRVVQAKADRQLADDLDRLSNGERKSKGKPSTKGQAREVERLRLVLGLSPDRVAVPETFDAAQDLVGVLFAAESRAKRVKPKGSARKAREHRPRSRTWTAALDAKWVKRSGEWLVETHRDNTPSDLSRPVKVVAASGKADFVLLKRPCGLGDVGTLWRFSDLPKGGRNGS